MGAVRWPRCARETRLSAHLVRHGVGLRFVEDEEVGDGGGERGGGHEVVGPQRERAHPGNDHPEAEVLVPAAAAAGLVGGRHVFERLGLLLLLLHKLLRLLLQSRARRLELLLARLKRRGGGGVRRGPYFLVPGQFILMLWALNLGPSFGPWAWGDYMEVPWPGLSAAQSS